MNLSNCTNMHELVFFYVTIITLVTLILSAAVSYFIFDDGTNKNKGYRYFGIWFFLFSSKGLDKKGRIWRICFLCSLGSYLSLYLLGNYLNYCS